MIDNIVIRVHGLQKHERLIAHLDKIGVGIRKKKKILDSNFDPVQEVRNMGFQRYHIDQATGRSWTEVYRHFMRSSNYDINYGINFNRDFVDFNINIPKYFFGTNLFQLVPHFNDNYRFEYEQKYHWDLATSHWMHFKSAYNYIMSVMLGDLVPSKFDTEVIRVDLAFNLFFPNVREAQFYLQFLKQHRKKNWRDSNENRTDYNTSLFWPSHNQTVKIYLKGDEVRGKEGDYKKILKRSKESFGDVKLSDKEFADMVAEISDRCMRFEVAFKPGGMSDIYWHSNMPKKDFREKWYTYQQYNKNGWFELGGVRYPDFTNGRKPMPADVRAFFDDGRKLYGKNIRFFLDADERLTNVKNFNYKVPFNHQFFCLLVRKFHEITKQFKVGAVRELEIYSKTMKYIDMDGVKKSMNLSGYKESTIRLLIGLLKTNSWSEIKDQKLVSEKTWYKYKDLFINKLGYENVNSDYVGIQNVDYTYSRYYHEIRPLWDRVATKFYPFKF